MSAIEVLGPALPWLIISVAVFSYLLAQYFQRKVFARVEYHRRGMSAETYQCVEVGNRVLFQTGGSFSLFRPTKERTLVNAVLTVPPEIKVFGFKTIRLHHVIEGYGETVDIRELKTQNPMHAGATATSEAVMSTAFEEMAKSVPRGKSDMMIRLVFLLVGLGWGLLLGVVLG